MKTAKLMLMVAFLAFGTMLFTQAEPDRPVIKIKLDEALQDRGLVKTMYAKLNLSDILNGAENASGVYSATVVYKRSVYKIYATKKSWVKFFLSHIGEVIHHKPDIK
jgi:hypothetical protein